MICGLCIVLKKIVKYVSVSFGTLGEMFRENANRR
jgi:hypothetical protein